MTNRLNRKGNLIHTTKLARLKDIARYGLVSQNHNQNWSIKRANHFKTCPCGQIIPQEEIDRFTQRGLVFFHSIGSIYPSSGQEVTMQNLWQGIYVGDFGILVEPENFLVGEPKKEEFELLAFQGDIKALEKREKTEYWEKLKRDAVFYCEGNSGEIASWEFRVPSCIPWKKFGGLIVAPNNLSLVIEFMQQFQPDNLKTVYDLEGKVLYEKK